MNTPLALYGTWAYRHNGEVWVCDMCGTQVHRRVLIERYPLYVSSRCPVHRIQKIGDPKQEVGRFTLSKPLRFGRNLVNPNRPACGW